MTDSNSLPDILDRHGVGRGARALDIGGPAYKGEESTRYLTDRLDRPVDVIALKAEQAAVMAEEFGEGIRILANEYAAEEEAYDVVVVSPLLGKLADVLADAAWRGERLLKPGGLFITFGIDPSALGAEGYKQPDAAVIDAYRPGFVGEDGVTSVLPPALDELFELLEAPPRKPGVRSYLTWMVLRRRPVLFPTAARIDVTGGLTRDASGEGLDVLLTGDFDTVLVTPGLPETDPRALRTAETLRALGRKILCVRDDETMRVEQSPSGFTVVGFADPRPELERRLRVLGVQPDEGQLDALHNSIRAGRLSRLIGTLARPGFVVHSEGAVALAAVGDGMSRLKVEHPGKAKQVRWVHDIRRFRQALAQATRLNRPDTVTCASDAVGRAVAQAAPATSPITVWDTPRLADRFVHRGKTLRQKTEIKGDIVVHEGVVDERIMTVLDALPGLPKVHLVLLGAAPGGIVKRLKIKAAVLGVSDRLHVTPAPTEDRLVGYIADADVGLALPDAGSDATARIFTHALAGLPTLVVGEADSAGVLAEWGVGEQADADAPGAVRAALDRILGQRAPYVAAIGRRPDLLLRFCWEVQASVLAQIYNGLEPTKRNPAKSLA